MPDEDRGYDCFCRPSVDPTVSLCRYCRMAREEWERCEQEEREREQIEDLEDDVHDGQRD